MQMMQGDDLDQDLRLQQVVKQCADDDSRHSKMMKRCSDQDLRPSQVSQANTSCVASQSSSRQSQPSEFRRKRIAWARRQPDARWRIG